METRLDNLEIKSAHFEVSIDAITDQMLQQQREIDHLRQQLQHLHALLAQMEPATAPGDEPPPPHY